MKYSFIFLNFVAVLALAKADEKNECTFSGAVTKLQLNQCGHFGAEKEFVIESEVLRSATYNKNGLAELSFGKKCFWFSRKGKNFQTPCLDQRPDAFSAKLSRYINSEGKQGYMNWSLMPVISARWDYALPFQTTFAKVCDNCKVVTVNENEAVGDVLGDNVKGGPWFIINLKGRVVKSCPQAQKAEDCQF